MSLPPAPSPASGPPGSVVRAAAAGLALGAFGFVVEGLLAARPFLAPLPHVEGVEAFLAAVAAAWLGVGLVGGAAAGALLGPIRRRPHHAPLPVAGGIATALAALGRFQFHHGMVLVAAPALAFGAAWLLAGRPRLLAAGSLGATAAVWLSLALPSPPGVAAGAASPAPRGVPSAAAGAPDLIVVVLDTVRVDHSSAYGYRRDTTPVLAELAREGALFTRAFSSGCWSVPAHASLFTGLSPSAHGATWEAPRLREGLPTLAGVLAGAGWRTALFTGNPWLSPDNGLARGFQHHRPSVPVHPVARAFLLRELGRAGDRDKGGARTVRAFRDFLDARDPERPYLAVLNVFEPHGPYDEVAADCGDRFLAPGADRRRARRASREAEIAEFEGTAMAEGDVALARDLYDGAVSCGDRVLGEVLDVLARSGRPERTAVVVLSDHGEAFGEHGAMGHAYGLWRELVQIPLVVRYPGVVPPGLRVEAPARIVDLAPTLLRWAGVPEGAWPAMEGRPLQPILAGGEAEPRIPVLEQYVPTWVRAARLVRHPTRRWPELEVRRRAVVVGDRRYERRSDGSESLYDWSTDPGERVDLAAGGPVPAEARRALDAATAGRAAPFTAPPPAVPASTGLDPVTEARLRSLGYLR